MGKIKAWAYAHRLLFDCLLFLFCSLVCAFGLIVAVRALPIESVGSYGFFGAVVFGEAYFALGYLFLDFIFDKRKDGNV